VNPTVLQPFGPRLWLADGPKADAAGFLYPTRMAVMRLTNGELLIWSPVGLSVAMGQVLAEFGEVRHLVAPISLHHLFLGERKAAYPNARVYTPPGLAAKRSDLAFDHELGDTPPTAFSISSSCAATGSRARSPSSTGAAARSSSPT
jgi:hypothetical protein